MTPRGRSATGSSAASGPGMPARYRGSDMVTSRASTADFPDPGPPVTTRTLSAGSGAAVSQATSCDSAWRRPVKNQPGRAACSTPRARGSQCSFNARSPASRDLRSSAADGGGSDRQRVWVGHAQQVPPGRLRRQPGKGGDRHHGQRRLSLRPVMRGDDPEGQLTAVRVSGEYDCPGHALPRRPGQRSRQRLRGAGHLQAKATPPAASRPARSRRQPARSPGDCPQPRPDRLRRTGEIPTAQQSRTGAGLSRFTRAKPTGGRCSSNRGSLISSSARSTWDGSSQTSTTRAASSRPAIVRTSSCSSWPRSCR